MEIAAISFVCLAIKKKLMNSIYGYEIQEV